MPLNLEWFSKENKNTTKLSNLKSLNSLVYVLASNYAEEKNLDDVIIFNQRKKPIESSNANIFVKKDGNLYTTLLSDGCVDGTMRLLICQNFKVVETSFTRKFLLDAEELFLTNSMGIRWVAKLGNKEYYENKISKNIVGFLNTLI